MEQKKDSLLSLIENEQEDTNIVKYYNSISRLILRNQTRQGITAAEKALKISQNIGYNKGITSAYSNIVVGYHYLGNKTDSLLYVNGLFERHLIKIKDTDRLYIPYLRYGGYYRKIGESDKAIEYFLKALQVVKKSTTLENKLGKIATIYTYIGNVHFLNQNSEKALEYYQEGLKMANDGLVKANLIFNCALIYRHYLDMPDTAMVYFERATEVFRLENDLGGVTAVLMERADYYDSQQKFERSNQLYHEALQIIQTNNLGSELPLAYINLALHYEKRKQFNNTVLYGEKSLDVTLEQKKFESLKDIYGVLQRGYSGLGNYEKAYEASINLIAVKDSINNTTLKGKVEELQLEFEVEQAQTENNLLKAEGIANQKAIRSRNVTSLALLLGLLLIGSWALIIYRNNRRKQKYNEELEEMVLERTTQLSKANNNLEQANYELKTFNYIASHDIKEPIRNIGTYAGFIFKKLPKELQANYKVYFDIIKTNSKQLYTLIEDFARYNQMSKDDEITRTSIDLNSLLASLEVSLYGTLQDSNGKIINKGLPAVYTSSSFLYTILKNIIENGLKFNKSITPTVSLAYKETSYSHDIYISDNGIGIEAENYEVIFEMFKKINESDEYKGSGIGLAIVKLLTNKIGAQITVESNTNTGSTFILKLPKIEE